MPDSTLYSRAATLLEADLGDELVALEPEQGNCFGFNEVATVIWRLLEQPRSFDQLKAHLLTQYDVGETECESDLRHLLDELVENGLLARSTSVGAAT